jgi:hypothetical protein
MKYVGIIMPKRQHIDIRAGTVLDLGMRITYPDSHNADSLQYEQNNLQH